MGGDELMTFEEKLTQISACIQEWFVKTGNMKAKPKDLMPYLIEKEIYLKDNRAGRPLRDDLREAYDKGLLYLITGVKVDKKEKNKNWSFYKVD